MILTLVLLLICSPFLWWYLLLQKHKSLSAIPGPKPIPILGNALDVGTSPQSLFNNVRRLFKEHGDLFKIYIGNELRVFISQAEILEQIMSSNVHITKSDGYNLLKCWLNTGLLTSTGEKWKIRRKMITPTFHFKILDQFLEVFNSNGNILANKLSKEIGNSFDLYPYIHLYSLDIICETSMGVRVSSKEDTNVGFVKSLKTLLDILIVRFFSPWKKFDFLFQFAPEYKSHTHCLEVVQKFAIDIIQQRRKEKSASKSVSHTSDDGIKRRVALLDMLLESEDNNILSDEDIREEINTFMFEGHDTTTSAMCFSLLALANHSDIQERVYEEISSVIGDEPYITMQHLQDTKYLDMVVREVLRLYPAVPFVERRLEMDANFGGFHFPKNTTLTLDLYSVLHNEKYFPEPEKFDPERFLPHKQAERHNYAYVPFSAGPRNCIGQKYALMDIKVTVIKVLQKYRLHSVPDFKPELGMAAILKSYNGINVRLEKRQTQ